MADSRPKQTEAVILTVDKAGDGDDESVMLIIDSLDQSVKFRLSVKNNIGVTRFIDGMSYIDVQENLVDGRS